MRKYQKFWDIFKKSKKSFKRLSLFQYKFTLIDVFLLVELILIVKHLQDPLGLLSNSPTFPKGLGHFPYLRVPMHAMRQSVHCTVYNIQYFSIL